MKIKFIYDKASKIDPEILKKAPENPQADYGVKLGIEFDVFGILVKNNIKSFLIDSFDNAYPIWYLSPIVEVIDSALPSDWKFLTDLADDEGFSLVIGFPALVSNRNFLYDLQDREQYALYEFRKYLVEYRKEYPLGR
jgi:hypothetical protein